MDYTFFADMAGLVGEVPPDSILSRTVYANAQIRVVMFGFAAGEELSEHTSTHAAVLHFLRGEAHLKLGSDEMDVQAGAWAHMEPNLPHSIKATTPTVMLLLMLEPGK